MILKNIAKKKIDKKVKDELLNSLRENNEIEEPEVKIANMIESGEEINI